MAKDNKSEIIIGIDPGTKATGFGVIQIVGNSFKLITFGTISPSYSLNLHSRYLIIFNELEKIIKKYNPEAIAIETQFVKKNIQIAIKLGMARGISILAALKNNISVFEYAPRVAKLVVVGNGRASKEQVKKMVSTLLNIEDVKLSEDAADALSLAICHAHRRR